MYHAPRHCGQYMTFIQGDDSEVIWSCKVCGISARETVQHAEERSARERKALREMRKAKEEQ